MIWWNSLGNKHKKKLLPLQREPQCIKIILPTTTAKHVVCGVRGYAAATNAQFNWLAADLNKITIPGMLVQFPNFFYSMYKKNDLGESIIQCIWIILISLV